MQRTTALFCSCWLLLTLAASAATITAEARPQVVDIDAFSRSAPIPSSARSSRDSLIVFGGPGTLEGKFQQSDGNPDRQGWEGVDYTLSTEQAWQPSMFHAANLDPDTPGNHAWWCGEVLESCDPDDPAEGYGNDWNVTLSWSAPVDDPGVPVTVRVTARLNIDLEPGYDFLFLEVRRDGLWDELWSRDGTYSGLDVDVSTTVDPADLAEGTVQLRWRVDSDGAWSDEDCFHPTSGACQIDLITVSFDQGAGPMQIGEVETAEPGAPSAWTPDEPVGVGDFSHIWSDLDDLDVCYSNTSPVLAFIDDGVVVPGTGGSPCVEWCYGPDGWIVNPTGGLVGEDAFIHNLAWSPPIELPGDLTTGALLEFDTYIHNSFNLFIDASIFGRWRIDSTADPTGQTGWSGPRDFNLVFEGGPGWRRHAEEVGTLLVDGARLVRIGLGVLQLRLGWDSPGVNGSPAPYYDNVRLTLHGNIGPEIRLGGGAQDAFPASGTVDLADLGAASVPIDAADFVFSGGGDLVRADEIRVFVGPSRDGADIARPRLHYVVSPNPIFDSFRGSGWPLAGEVMADSSGGLYPYAFDLPDEGFLFPGDVLQYYITATETYGGQEYAAILPADTTGFGRFRAHDAPQGDVYARSFTMRALPTVQSADAPLAQPPVLVINRTASVEIDVWQRALAQAGYREGIDYDLFHSQGGWNNHESGVGTVATLDLLSGYEAIVAVAGPGAALVGPGDPQVPDGLEDTPLIDAWLALGDRGLIISGDFAVEHLANSDEQFVLDWVGGSGGATTTWHEAFAGQLSPPVVASPEAPFSIGLPGYQLASCQAMATLATSSRGRFSPVTPTTATVLAEFTGPDHAPGEYPFAAIMLVEDPVGGSRVLAVNHSLAPAVSDRFHDAPDQPLPARSLLVAGLLAALGAEGGSLPVAVPALPTRLELSGHPNPFNPRVTLSLAVPRAGRASVDIFDVRGRKVRGLLAGELPAGVHQMAWDGTDGRGRALGAGLYFARLRVHGEDRVLKLTLLK